jgi:hypothetical protein
MDYHSVRQGDLRLLPRDATQVDFFPPCVIALGTWNQPETYLTVRTVFQLPDGSQTLFVSSKDIPLLSFLYDLFVKCQNWTSQHGSGKPLLKFLNTSDVGITFPVYTDPNVRVWRCSLGHSSQGHSSQVGHSSSGRISPSVKPPPGLERRLSGDHSPIEANLPSVIATKEKVSAGDRVILTARLAGIVGVTNWTLSIEIQDVMIIQ